MYIYIYMEREIMYLLYVLVYIGFFTSVLRKAVKGSMWRESVQTHICAIAPKHSLSNGPKPNNTKWLKPAHHVRVAMRRAAIT